MNRKQEYFKHLVSDDDINEWFDDVEDSFDYLNLDLCEHLGVVFGLEVTETAPLSIRVSVSPGVAHNRSTGKRVPVMAAQEIDLSVDENGDSTNVTGAGNERWLKLYVKDLRLETDPRVDGNGNTVYYDQAESFEFVVRMATEQVSGTNLYPAQDATMTTLANIQRLFAIPVIGPAQISYVSRHERISRKLDEHETEANAHDAGNVDDNTAGGYHTPTVQGSLDNINTAISGHLDGAANKHDASEIDYEGGGYGGAGTAEAALVYAKSSIQLLANGTFKLGDDDGHTALIVGNGAWAATPIHRAGAGLFEVYLAAAVADWTKIVVQMTVSGHGAPYLYAIALEDPSLRGGASNMIKVLVSDARDGTAIDPPDDDSAYARLNVTIWNLN